MPITGSEWCRDPGSFKAKASTFLEVELLVDVEFAAATLSELIERVDRGTRLGRMLVKNSNLILKQEINEFSMNGILPGGKGTPGNA